MKIVTIIARILLALVFLVFGANGFFRFLPTPPLPSGLAGDFLKVFFESGYVYVVSAFQVLGGLLVLIGLWVPLGLTILAPIIINIWSFHCLMAPQGIAPAVVVTLLELFLLWRYRLAFAGLLRS